MHKRFLAFAAFGALAMSAHAGEIYGGAGFPGLTLGYSHGITSDVAVRADYTGGLHMSRSGEHEGVTFEGKLKTQSASALVDYFPTSTGFRITGGVNFNDTKINLTATGGAATVNGKTVSLSGEYFNMSIKQPSVTPYLGVGYGSRPNAKQSGWGFYADAGVMFGKFRTSTSTSLVGRQGITQADVDAQTATVRDDVSKLSVLPRLTVGVTYRF